MRILVVCGAGASSTFVAQRLARAADAAGRDCEVSAGTIDTAHDADADLILVGPHLAVQLESLDALAAGHATVVLPADVFSDLDGSRTLALALPYFAEPHKLPHPHREEPHV